MYSIQKVKSQLAAALHPLYPREEAGAIARRLLEEAYQMPYPQLVLSNHKGTEKEAMLAAWLQQLLQNQPLQYILSKAEFQGMTLKVRKGVLIPRPETELLCQILSERGWLQEGMTTADLCTGSGAIALYLAHFATRVEAVELSCEALKVAEENILAMGAIGKRITLRCADLLDPAFIPLYQSYDLVVSNPPYILPREAETMEAHVLEQEPGMALFVPEEQPLLFYQAILKHYHAHLRVGGRFAFEINPLLKEELKQLFEEAGYAARLLEDYAHKWRFLIAEKRV